jgi:hypothetical protein
MSKNRGVIKIARSTWEDIGCPHIADVHNRLLLPDDYKVEKVIEDTGITHVHVASESIPAIEGVFLANLVPYYALVDGMPKLDRIEVEGK